MKWPSWTSVVLGIWLFISPWVLQYGDRMADLNSFVLGILVFILGIWSATASAELAGLAWANAVFGVWLIVSPWVLRFSAVTRAMGNDVIIGVALLILAAIRISSTRMVAAGGTRTGRA
jgi:hypothetical protein